MSDWTANPQDAKWYGEVTFGGEDYTSYNYGFSNDPDPDPRELAPEGTDILEFAVVPNGDRGDVGDFSF